MKKFQRLYVLALLPTMLLTTNSSVGSNLASDTSDIFAIPNITKKVSGGDITSLDTSTMAQIKDLGTLSEFMNSGDPYDTDILVDSQGYYILNLTGVSGTGLANYSSDNFSIFDNAGNLLSHDYDSTDSIYLVYSYTDAFSFDDFESSGPLDSVEVYSAYNTAWTYEALMTDGATKTIPVNYASHYTQEEILSLVTAVDMFGQEVDYVVTSSDYEDAIGSYTIVLTATDSYGLTATCTLNVVVLDKSSPILAKKNDYTTDYGNTITEADLLACVTASDNSGIDPTLSIQSDGGLNIGGPATFGTYTVVIKATDNAGNSSTLPITVNVIDETAPIFTKNDGEVGDTVVYGYSETHSLTKTALMNLYTATDYIDGECAIFSDDDINTAIGTHTIILQATDQSGNTGSLTVTYEIDADIPPVFIVDSSLIQVSDDSPLTKANILSIVESIIPDDAKYPTLTDENQFAEYLENANVIGSKTTIDYSYVTASEIVEDGSLVIEVIDEDGSESDTRNVWEKIGDWFKNVGNSISEFFQKIKNFFSFKGWNTDAEVEASSSAVEESTASN